MNREREKEGDGAIQACALPALASSDFTDSDPGKGKMIAPSLLNNSDSGSQNNPSKFQVRLLFDTPP